jgi:hypothetical protein
VLGGYESKSVPVGSLAGLRSGLMAFGGGYADKDSVKYASGAEFRGGAVASC